MRSNNIPEVQTILAITRQCARIHGYDNLNAEFKQLFHRDGILLLRRLARDLGLDADQYDIRSNPGGVAVSGEVTLHTDHLYVQLSPSPYGHGEFDILYRRCRGRSDYSGERNHFLPLSALEDYPAFLRRIRSLLPNDPPSARTQVHRIGGS
jgi:hypothetical protein